MLDQVIDGDKTVDAVIVQDTVPISKRAVRGDNDGPTFIPIRDGLKQEFGTLCVHESMTRCSMAMSWGGKSVKVHFSIHTSSLMIHRN